MGSDRKSAAGSDRELLLHSRLFDTDFYLAQYPDVAAAGVHPVEHYLTHGAEESRRPHPTFDGDWYLRRNPDVESSGMNPLVHYLRHGESEGRPAHKPAAVYTSITGGWDNLRPPLIADPDLDYFVFADEYLSAVPAPWVCRRMKNRWETDRLTTRYFKTQPHLVLPEYRLSLWADGAFQLRDVTAAAIESLAGSAPIAFFKHPERTCAYAEAEMVRHWKLDTPPHVKRMVKLLEDSGFPRNAGLCEAGLLVRRHGDPDLNRAMEEWWGLISTVSYRDQLSFMFVLWRNRIPFSIIPGDSRRNALGYWMGHRPASEAEAQRRLLERERELALLYHTQDSDRAAAPVQRELPAAK